jgi:hypothetical protein
VSTASIALGHDVLSTTTAGSFQTSAHPPAIGTAPPQAPASVPPVAGNPSRTSASLPVATPSHALPAQYSPTFRHPDYVLIPRAVFERHRHELLRLGIYERMAASSPGRRGPSRDQVLSSNIAGSSNASNPR